LALVTDNLFQTPRHIPDVDLQASVMYGLVLTAHFTLLSAPSCLMQEKNFDAHNAESQDCALCKCDAAVTLLAASCCPYAGGRFQRTHCHNNKLLLIAVVRLK
jgi:hypothetical protein